MIGIKAEKLAAKGRCPPLCVRPWIVGSQTPSSPSSPPPLLAFLSWSPILLSSAPQISSTVESQALRLKPEASILNLLDYWHLWMKFTGFCQTKFDTISKSFPYFGQPGGYKCSHSFHNCLHRSQMVNVLFGEKTSIWHWMNLLFLFRVAYADRKWSTSQPAIVVRDIGRAECQSRFENKRFNCNTYFSCQWNKIV